MSALPCAGAKLTGAVPELVAPWPMSLDFASHFATRLPAAAAQAGVALAASTSRDLAHRQVVAAHRAADLARRQSDWVIRAARGVFPGSREHLDLVERLAAQVLDTWLDSANAFGRTYARKGFAFPVRSRART